MSTEVKIPSVGESVSSGVISRWHKAAGEYVKTGEVLLTLETDKVSTEVAAEADGVVELLVEEGREVHVGEVVAIIRPGVAPEQQTAVAQTEQQQPAGQQGSQEQPLQEVVTPPTASIPPQQAPPEIAPGAPSQPVATSPANETAKGDDADDIGRHGPAAARVMRQEGIAPSDVSQRSGLGGRITRDDLEAFLKNRAEHIKASTPHPASTQPTEPTQSEAKPADDAKPAETKTQPPASSQLAARSAPSTLAVSNRETDAEAMTTRKPMSPLRKKIAQQLVNAQRQAALLTTFNECDMSAVIAIRSRMQESFQARHGIKLGFMSFFVKAVVNALQEVPAVNARIDGDDIVQHHFYDIGVAVGTDRGLIVPVLRRADTKSFAALEKELSSFAAKARDGKIQIEDLRGGVFTITNGGIYGSLMSTPIVNPPQSAILGMHAIKERPVVVHGETVIRPMMYLALTYDHRVIDGKEAVTFLVRVKEAIEDPMQLIL